MTNGGEVKFHSYASIMETLALIPEEMSRRLKKEYRITNVVAQAAMYEFGRGVSLWQIVVEYEDV